MNNSDLAVSRLLRLAQFMEDSVPDESFHLGTWFSNTSGEMYMDPYKALATPMCGTTACACGWAATIPEFKAAGLSLSDSTGTTAWIKYDPTGKVEDERVGFSAAAAFFNISYDDACKLFAEEEYVGEPNQGDRMDVVKRIRKLVADKFDVHVL